jgi:hypothetical protein
MTASFAPRCNHIRGRRGSRSSGSERVAANQRLFRKSLGEFDEGAPVGRILDLSKGDDESQPFDNIQVDLIIPKQLQQFVAGVIGIFDVHSELQKRVQLASPENDLNELAIKHQRLYSIDDPGGSNESRERQRCGGR